MKTLTGRDSYLEAHTGGGRDALSSSQTVTPLSCGRALDDLDVRLYGDSLSRPRGGSGRREPVDAAGDGDRCLRHHRPAAGRRFDRLAQAKVLKKRLAAAPNAGHMRYDYGAARPVFLNIGRIAHPNRIRAGVIARINTVGLGLVTGINSKPPRRSG